MKFNLLFLFKIKYRRGLGKLNNLKVLVLDDDKTITDGLSDFLNIEKLVPYSVHTPQQAFDILDTIDIDIAFIDIVLPEMDGIQVVEWMTQKHPTVEIIIISGKGTLDIAIEAFRYGAVDFIKKPFSIIDIRSALKRTKKYLEKPIKLELENIKELDIFQQNFSIRVMSESLGISITSLNEYLNFKFGMSSQKIVETLRLESALFFLEKNHSLYFICKKIGYSNTRTFRRVFKKRLMITPSEYRALFKGRKCNITIREKYINSLWNCNC